MNCPRLIADTKTMTTATKRDKIFCGELPGMSVLTFQKKIIGMMNPI